MLVDVNEAVLARDAPVRATRHRLGAAVPAALHTLPGEVEAAHGGPDPLAENVGVALDGRYGDVAGEDLDRPSPSTSAASCG